jgi:hypothetical protein
MTSRPMARSAGVRLEALAVRGGLAAVAWFSMARDLRSRGARWTGYLVPYTHWNMALLALYAPLSFANTVRARPGRLNALSVSRSEPILYGVFVWVRRAPSGPFRRFRRWAVAGGGAGPAPHARAVAAGAHDLAAGQRAFPGGGRVPPLPGHRLFCLPAWRRGHAQRAGDHI